MRPNNCCLGLCWLLRLLCVEILLLGKFIGSLFILTTLSFMHLFDLQGQTRESNLHLTLLDLLRTCFHQRYVILVVDCNRRRFTAICVRWSVSEFGTRSWIKFDVLGSRSLHFRHLHFLVILQNELLKLVLYPIGVIGALFSFQDIFNLLGFFSCLMKAFQLGLLKSLDIPLN